MNRDQLILSIRPTLPIKHDIAIKAAEKFQNQTLRPILKLQNDLIVVLFEEEVQLRKRPLDFTTPKNLRRSIKELLSNTIQLRKCIIYSIVSFFTKVELKQYHSHKSEYNKRIIGMAIERIAGQLKSPTIP